jgi:hypothetical protein
MQAELVDSLQPMALLSPTYEWDAPSLGQVGGMRGILRDGVCVNSQLIQSRRLSFLLGFLTTNTYLRMPLQREARTSKKPF